MRGKRVSSKQTGRTGTVAKIGNCLWVRMDDDGTEWSGGTSYWKVLPTTNKATRPDEPSSDDAAAALR